MAQKYLELKTARWVWAEKIAKEGFCVRIQYCDSGAEDWITFDCFIRNFC